MSELPRFTLSVAVLLREPAIDRKPTGSGRPHVGWSTHGGKRANGVWDRVATDEA